MKYADDYLDLYTSGDDWYLKYVNKELKKLKRRYDKNESKKTTRKNK